MDLTEVWEKAVHSKSYSEFKSSIGERISGIPETVENDRSYSLIEVETNNLTNNTEDK